MRVEVTVAPVADPPVVSPATLQAEEDDAGQGVVSGSDPDDDALTFRVTDDPDHGVLTLDANLGTFQYVPWPGWFGADAFEVWRATARSTPRR